MTDLQKRFAEEYVIDYKITAAGKRAGIQGDNINVTAWQMLQLQEVQEYVEQLQVEAAEKCSITKQMWLNEWKKLGFSDIKNYMGDDLEVKPLSDTKDTEAIKSIKKTVTESEFGTKTSVEFALHDKANALTNIGKHLGFYAEDNEQSKPQTTLNFQPIIQTSGVPLASSEKDVSSE